MIMKQQEKKYRSKERDPTDLIRSSVQGQYVNTKKQFSAHIEVVRTAFKINTTKVFHYATKNTIVLFRLHKRKYNIS